MYIITKKDIQGNKIYSQIDWSKKDLKLHIYQENQYIYQLFCESCGEEIEKGIHIDCVRWTDFEINICAECLKESLELLR